MYETGLSVFFLNIITPGFSLHHEETVRDQNFSPLDVFSHCENPCQVCCWRMFFLLQSHTYLIPLKLLTMIIN